MKGCLVVIYRWRCYEGLPGRSTKVGGYEGLSGCYTQMRCYGRLPGRYSKVAVL